MKHIFPFSHVHARYLALGPRFGLVLVPQVKGIGSRRSRSGQIFEIFKILSGAGDVKEEVCYYNRYSHKFTHTSKRSLLYSQPPCVAILPGASFAPAGLPVWLCFSTHPSMLACHIPVTEALTTINHKICLVCSSSKLSRKGTESVPALGALFVSSTNATKSCN